MTPKQQRFVEEYLIDLNATQAAIRAGYSEKTAGSVGNENLTKPEIAAAVQQAMNARSARTEITADRVLQELAKIGFSDIRKVFTPGGNLLPIQDLDDETAATMSSVEVVTRKVPGAEEAEVEHVAKIKLWDKRAALELLGKHLKLFTDKVETNGNVTVNIGGHAANL